MPLQKFIVQVGARCIEAIYTRYNSRLINPPFLKATMKHGRSEHHGENNNFHGAIFTFLRESFHYPIRHFLLQSLYQTFSAHIEKNIKEKVEICSLTVKIVRLGLTVECCGNEKKEAATRGCCLKMRRVL